MGKIYRRKKNVIAPIAIPSAAVLPVKWRVTTPHGELSVEELRQVILRRLLPKLNAHRPRPHYMLVITAKGVDLLVGDASYKMTREEVAFAVKLSLLPGEANITRIRHRDALVEYMMRKPGVEYG